jgi:hypothetical protein
MVENALKGFLVEPCQNYHHERVPFVFGGSLEFGNDLGGSKSKLSAFLTILLLRKLRKIMRFQTAALFILPSIVGAFAPSSIQVSQMHISLYFVEFVRCFCRCAIYVAQTRCQCLILRFSLSDSFKGFTWA